MFSTTMKHIGSQMSETTTPVYWLQMEPENNLRSAESRAFPLALLDNSYILETKLLDGSDQVKFFIDACQEPDKIVTHSHQNVQTVNENMESPLNLKCNNQEPMSTRSREHLSANTLVTANFKEETICELPNRIQVLENYVNIPDSVVPPRAVAVLPSILQIRRDIISPRRALPARARFGPVQGIINIITDQVAARLKLETSANKTPLFLLKDGTNTIHIDVSDKDKSNWIGLLPLGDELTANIWLHEENNALYAVTTEIISSRKPMKLGYSKKYAQCYGLPGPTKDIDSLLPTEEKIWWCNECQRTMQSSYLLQRHMDMFHKEDYPVTRRKYRCRQCTRTFSRLFTLRRHIARHCTKKMEKSENAMNTDNETQASLNAILNSEDNRIPSDESFQNYSNGLDFSTNLFDTDRMPSLDISVRSEGEFNPYSIGYKDDNSLANDLINPQNGYEEPAQKKDEQILVTCPYCNQVVVKEKKRQHVSECSARRYECECKKVFSNKKLLSNHIFTQHSNDAKEIDKDKTSQVTALPTSSEDKKPFKCDLCQRAFKRRGMLVNHSWQVHKTVSSAPLERRIRHYPCVSCSKIYRTAAKRDRHVKIHHPEATLVRVALEGGTRVARAADCGACPRQYATRAKMLQHQRQHHPHLAHLLSKKTCKPKNNTAEAVRLTDEDF